MTKEFWKSKTFYFALLYGLVHIAGLFGYLDYTPGTDVTEIVNVLASVVMLILRFTTTQRLSVRSSAYRQ